MSDHFRLSGTTPYAATSEDVDVNRHTAADLGNALSETYAAYADDYSIQTLPLEDLVLLADYAAFRDAMNEAQAEFPFMFNDNVKYPLSVILGKMAETEVARNHFPSPFWAVVNIAKTLLWVSPDSEA